MRWLSVMALTALTFAAILSGATTKLYLRDGSFHLVSEYKVESDRVRFFAVERGEWEEMPLEMVDLKKTQDAIQAVKDADAGEKKVLAEEDAAERALRKEIRSIPAEPGVYQVLEDAPMRALKQAELKVIVDKKRRILTKISPVPVFSGKSRVEIDGESSGYEVKGDRPEFYFRLQTPERFGLVQCWPGKGVRILEKWDVVPVVKEIVVEQQEIKTFRKQVGEDLYKIWPMDPLPPGEYAFVEFTEGKGNTQAWDFSLRPAK